MEQTPDAMAAEIAHDAVAVRLGVALDRIGDVAKVVAGLRLLDAEHQAFVGDIDQLARLQGHVADQIHAAGVAVPAIDDRRHVDVDDVAVLQRFLARDAVANHMVDRDAAALGVAAITERRRHRARGERHLVDNVVERLGRDSGDDVGRQRVEDLGGEPPGPAHPFEALRPVQLDDAVASLDPIVCSHGDILSHAP
jgi:hypothetical protein